MSTDPGSLGQTISHESPAEPDIEDVLDDLETLEELVDSPAERQQVRETMRTARRANTPRVIGRLRDSFDLRDAGEAVVGAFIFGALMIVEGGTLEIGEAIAGSPAALVSTTAFGLLVVLGILHAARFQEVESEMLYDVIPLRLVGILSVAGCLSAGLMTVWGACRVESAVRCGGPVSDRGGRHGSRRLAG